MGAKVLIIDDERDTCTLLRKFLTRLGYKVFTASTLQTGLTMVDNVIPDIVFLDNNLPDGFGWEHISVIQKALPKARINLISAYKWIQVTTKDTRDVSVKFIEKPITFAALKQYL
jgi:two-component system, OmpR family, response regulator